MSVSMYCNKMTKEVWQRSAYNMIISVWQQAQLPQPIHPWETPIMMVETLMINHLAPKQWNNCNQNPCYSLSHSERLLYMSTSQLLYIVLRKCYMWINLKLLTQRQICTVTYTGFPHRHEKMTAYNDRNPWGGRKECIIYIEGFPPEWCISTVLSCLRYTILIGNPRYAPLFSPQNTHNIQKERTKYRPADRMT